MIKHKSSSLDKKIHEIILHEYKHQVHNRNRFYKGYNLFKAVVV